MAVLFLSGCDELKEPLTITHSRKDMDGKIAYIVSYQGFWANGFYFHSSTPFYVGDTVQIVKIKRDHSSIAGMGKYVDSLDTISDRVYDSLNIILDSIERILKRDINDSLKKYHEPVENRRETNVIKTLTIWQKICEIANGPGRRY
jgi:hypothetical protein